VPLILLLEVANLVVELFEVVAESHNLVFGGSNRVLKTHDVFIPLRDHFLLVPDPVLRRLNLCLHAVY